MATAELEPGERFSVGGVVIDSQELDGESQTFVTLDGWKRRAFDLEIDRTGGHVDFLEFNDVASERENQLALKAIARFARKIAPTMVEGGIVTVEDWLGNFH